MRSECWSMVIGYLCHCVGHSVCGLEGFVELCDTDLCDCVCLNMFCQPALSIFDTASWLPNQMISLILIFRFICRSSISIPKWPRSTAMCYGTACNKLGRCIIRKLYPLTHRDILSGDAFASKNQVAMCIRLVMAPEWFLLKQKLFISIQNHQRCLTAEESFCRRGCKPITTSVPWNTILFTLTYKHPLDWRICCSQNLIKGCLQ